MKTLLITGGAGFIGSHFCKIAKQNGYNPVVFDNLSTGHKEFVKWGDFVEGDLHDYNLLVETFKKYKPLAVIHFAASIEVGESVENPYKYYDNNVSGMISLLQAMEDAKVKYLVFSSSAATYGIPEKLPITEDTPLNPINPYGETKMMMEKIMHWADKANGIKSIALRYFNVAGASSDGSIGEDHGPETHLIPNILKSAIAGDGNFTIFGDDYNTKDGTNVRDYVQVEDLIDAHILALKHVMDTNKSDVFNLGTAQGYSNFEILEAAKKVTGIDIPYTIGARRGGDPDSLVADSSKARKVLGWKPKHEDVDDVIATAWNWHKSHPKGYEDK